MFRMRRFRAFLLIAALSAATLYYMVHVRHTTLSDVDKLRHLTFGQTSHKDYSTDSPPNFAHSPPPDPEVEPHHQPTTTLRRVAQPTLDDFTEPTPTAIGDGQVEKVTGEELLSDELDQDEEFRVISGGPVEAERVLVNAPPPRWRPQKEHNPVSADQLIRLPSGKPRSFTRIQHNFPTESNAQKSDRLRKLVAVREAFRHAWQGYEKYAMPHDELLAVSRSWSDSFMGWGATLIDNLDTLWIMDLKHDFEKAVNETGKIDFATSQKKEIPMFETVIRVLGGLVSAYDLSDHQYPVLLEKATELADILMGAFDTPNRMPDLFYKWAPSYASQQHRAGTRASVAQLGSLSMEFTRLAQITKNHKYYDAIARVQNALDDFQMETEMPGLWPLVLDASGCKKEDQAKLQSEHPDSGKPVLLKSGHVDEDELWLHGEKSVHLPQKYQKSNTTKAESRQADDNVPSILSNKDVTKAPGNMSSLPIVNNISEDEFADRLCKPQGLHYEPYAKKYKFAIAAQSDSTYEYMPKMHRLIGGLSSQYETMYQSAAKMIREKILYRPMITDNSRKILFPAMYEIEASKKVNLQRAQPIWEATHLGCFAGGMFGLAARIFDIPADMEIARQLTDGCIWAYESTPTKIMAEKFELVPCKDKSSCPWDEVQWHNALDPKLKERMDAVKAWNQEQKKLYQQTGMNVAKDSNEANEPLAAPKPQATVFKGAVTSASDSKKSDSLRKRDPPVDEVSTRASSGPSEENEVPGEHLGFVPKVAISHKSYVKARVQEERLPPGYTKFHDRSYILRPEAIESVFIMWRLTGEDYWRQKGWDMFRAIQEATHTEVGNAGLEDVTSILGEKIDKMESFWMAETLKYFYLLFSDPDVISLDDYVLNTEAHPFRVPKS